MAAEKDPIKYFKSEIKRLNYYNSQFLKEDDFLDEQLYHNQMRFLHQRALHTWGVVEGLEVKQVSGKVTVGAGIAVDRLGREIVLPAQSDPIALDTFAANARVYVTIKYGEVFDAADKDTQSTSKLYTRTTERPVLNRTTTAPAADATEVVLAVVVLDNDKAIAQIDTSTRRYSGSRFGSSADGKEFSLYSDSAGVWHLYDASKGADRLTIDNNGQVGIGRSGAIGAKLDVNGEVRSQILRIADGNGALYPDNWIGMASNIDGATKWLHIGGITDAGERRLALLATRAHLSGSLGIGTVTPVSQLHVRKDAVGALGPILTLMNNGGSAGAGAAIDFHSYNSLGKDAGARLQTLDDGNCSEHFAFLTKAPGSNNNSLTERVRISSKGNLGIGTNDPGDSRLKIGFSATDFADFAFSTAGGGQLQFIAWASGWNINTMTDGKRLHINRDAKETSDVLIGRAGKELCVKGNTGRVGIGGVTAPAVALAVNGAGGNVYSTDLWVENNVHIQGNETMAQGGGRGRLRIGTAWNYVGLYAEPSSNGSNNDLVLGSSSGHVRLQGSWFVSSGPISLRMLGGTVNATGVITSPGMGFTVTKPANTTGLYDITFTQPFNGVPAASVTQIYPDADNFGTGGNTRDNATIVGINADKMRVKTGDADGGASNRWFTFVVIGQR